MWGTVALLAAVSTASAGSVVIGGGWQASWHPDLDPFVDINPVTVVGDAVFIQKSAEFTQGPVGGVFPSIPIVFEQIAYPAATSIVIDDEIIKNSTSFPWDDFHIDLLNGPDVAFDPAATAASGGGGPIGWTIDPFLQAAFTPDLTRLDIWDGVVPAGGLWFPGDGLTNGQLWIDVVPKENEPYTTFILKETPTPEPATMALLAMGGLALIRRRK
jgi:hypothetical protein